MNSNAPTAVACSPRSVPETIISAIAVARCLAGYGPGGGGGYVHLSSEWMRPEVLLMERPEGAYT